MLHVYGGWDLFRSQFDPGKRIHRQNIDSCASCGSRTDDDGTSKDEMIVPSIRARMEKTNNQLRLRIDTCEIGSFVEIAVLAAGEGKIRFVGCACMLTRDDV